MNYDVILTMRLDSDRGEERIAKSVESLFEFGTIKDSIVDGLQLLHDPHLLMVAVTRAPGDQPPQSDSTA